MQENAFKYISSEGKNIYVMPGDCKTGHNSTGGNRALSIYIRTAGSGYVLCIPLENKCQGQTEQILFIA